MSVEDRPWKSKLSTAFVDAGRELGFEHADINGENQTGRIRKVTVMLHSLE